MPGVRMLCLEAVSVSSLDDAGLEAALAVVGRHVRRVKAYEAALTAGLKRRRGDVRPIVKRDRTRTNREVKDLDAGAAAVEAVANARWCAEHPERNPSLAGRADLDHRYYDALVEIAGRILNGDTAPTVTLPGKNASAANRRTPPPVTILIQADGAASTLDGHPLTASTIGRLACHAQLFAFATTGQHVVIDMARHARNATVDQYLALLARDRKCQVPGCRVPGKHTVAHHLIPFPHGPTDLANLVLVCDRHHHLLHEGRWRLERTPTGALILYRPDGSVFDAAEPDDTT